MAMAANKPIYEDTEAKHSTPPPEFEDSANFNEKASFWTRMGCTPESFKPRTLADKHNQLNQTLKSRHMNMIAIGKSETQSPVPGAQELALQVPSC